MRVATGVYQRDRLDRLSQVAGKKRHSWEDDVHKMNEILGDGEIRGIIIDVHSAPRIMPLQECGTYSQDGRLT
jgi:hypothetical protein